MWLAGAQRGWERRVNYGWMDEVEERGREGGREGGEVSGEGLCPADRQAASWWSHLASQS